LDGPSHNVATQKEPPDSRKRPYIPINHIAEPGNPFRKEKARFGLDHLKAGQYKEIANVLRAEPVLMVLRHFQAQTLACFENRFPEEILVRHNNAGFSTAK
jgi:hypothetical protein